MGNGAASGFGGLINIKGNAATSGRRLARGTRVEYAVPDFGLEPIPATAWSSSSSPTLLGTKRNRQHVARTMSPGRKMSHHPS